MQKVSVFIKESYQELRKVSWPNKKQVYNYMWSVIGISIVFALFLGLLDIFFSLSIEELIM